MKNALVQWRQILSLGGVLLASPLAMAQQQQYGPYFTGALGGTVPENIKLKEFLGPASGTVKLDPGFHFGVAGGFNFTDWLGVEVESGALVNSIDKIGSTSPDAGVTHIPLMANAVLRYDRDDFALIPYVAAGVGGDTSIFWINDDLGLDGSDADFVFAYQLMFGVRYRINEKMSAGVGYKWYHADSANWDVHNAAGGIRFGESTIHAISAVFTMKF
jgi:opacity protein-like surface antigen